MASPPASGFPPPPLQGGAEGCCVHLSVVSSLGPDGPHWGFEVPLSPFPCRPPCSDQRSLPGASLGRRRPPWGQWEFAGTFGGSGRRGLGTGKWVGRALTGCPQSQGEAGHGGAGQGPVTALPTARRQPSCSVPTHDADQCLVLFGAKILPGADGRRSIASVCVGERPPPRCSPGAASVGLPLPGAVLPAQWVGP